MSEISEFEARITAALERIGRAVAVAEKGQVAAPTQVDGDDAQTEKLEALEKELAEEREANARLEARVKAIQRRQEIHVAGLEGEVEKLRSQLMDHDTALQKLREMNGKLRDVNIALRTANADGLADPSLINTSLQTELDALKTSREADTTEMNAILTDLRDMVARAEDLGEDDEQTPVEEV
ncbi:hypothetical protein [Celeribacter litoreus]|uniref:hypothetical protein n=1 Tax=Celeribacter litoreus TaxID=2876714 RepID=UPI001CCD95A5|nr:hypothetical protein [Celeribacter litoreus]MCA0044561.1 hypothetical protein [Celeribacter litoreus]